MKLSKLTKEQKLELLQILEEKEKRVREGKPRYAPHPGQLRVHQSIALERYLFCGNAFGKSTVLVNEVHWAATGFNPITKEYTKVPAKMVLLLDSPEKIDDFITEYRKWNTLIDDQLHKRGKANYSFITYPNGSTITVLSHEVMDLKLEGSQWTHIFADEPPPRRVFLSLFRGMRIKGSPSRVLLAGTPLAAPWLRTEVWEPWSRGESPHVECFKGDTEENRDNLADGYIERFASKLSEKEKEIRLRGGWFDLDGLALAHLWRRDTHVLDDYEFDRETYPCVVALDPHPEKRHHAILLGADENGLVVLKELALKLEPRKFAKELKQWMMGYRVLDIVCDNYGSTQYTGGDGFKSFIQVLNEEGVRVRATTYDEKGDDAWIMRITDALAIPTEPNNFGQRLPRLRVMASCQGTIADIETVQWVKFKNLDEYKPKLDISSKDFLACVKYALACNLSFQKRKERAYYVTRPAYGLDLPTKRSARPKLSFGRR